MKTILMLVAMALCGVQAHAAAVGSRGGKKPVSRMNDSNGNPVLFNDDKPWKVFESTQANTVLLVDENGIAPKQGMVRQICLSTAATTAFGVVYDSNTTAGLSIASAGVRIAPPIVASTTLTQCLQVNALFTSGLVIEGNTGIPYGGVYVYWRELGGFK